MNAQFKARLIKIQRELEELRQDHEIWMEEHEDENWEYTPAGEKASDEQNSIGYALDELASVTNFDPREED